MRAGLQDSLRGRIVAPHVCVQGRDGSKWCARSSPHPRERSHPLRASRQDAFRAAEDQRRSRVITTPWHAPRREPPRATSHGASPRVFVPVPPWPSGDRSSRRCPWPNRAGVGWRRTSSRAGTEQSEDNGACNSPPKHRDNATDDADRGADGVSENSKDRGEDAF